MTLENPIVLSRVSCPLLFTVLDLGDSANREITHESPHQFRLDLCAIILHSIVFLGEMTEILSFDLPPRMCKLYFLSWIPSASERTVQMMLKTLVDSVRDMIESGV